MVTGSRVIRETTQRVVRGLGRAFLCSNWVTWLRPLLDKLKLAKLAMRTRSSTRSLVADAAVTLASLPDDAFLLVLAACVHDRYGVPLFEEVKGLYCSNALRQQLHQLQPLVGIHSLTVVQRPAHGPWCVTLLYSGELMKPVLEQARQGRVRLIDTTDTFQSSLTPAVARRVVPELLGAGCSLLELILNGVQLNSTWAGNFGEAAVCSAVLSMLSLQGCGLWGSLPELRLPALQDLNLCYNNLRGGLEPLRSCTALRVLSLGSNHITGGLEPLRSCTALQVLNLSRNKLTGGLEPLRACKALSTVRLSHNNLTGDLEPLRGCKALWKLIAPRNLLTGELEPLSGCTALKELNLTGNPITGGIEPLRACKALQELYLVIPKGSPPLLISDEDKAHFEEQCDAGLFFT